MTDNSYFDKLTEISAIILRNETDFSELKPALESFKSLLHELSEMAAEDFNNRENIYLVSGKAIAPEWAIRCIDDLLRTKRFMCGLYKAVLSVQELKKESPTYILYTGTGPFATLVLPLITRFSPKEIQFILVEINPISYEHAKTVFKSLNAEAYIAEFHLADAAVLQLDSPNRIDIHVVECLQHALAREPQVTITYNMVSQLREDAILIPQNIELFILQIDTALRQEHMMSTISTTSQNFLIKSRPVFTLNKKEVSKHASLSNSGELRFPKEVVHFENGMHDSYNELAIGTEITIFEDERLEMNDSGLTIPKIIGYKREGETMDRVETQYIVSNDPELRITFLKE